MATGYPDAVDTFDDILTTDQMSVPGNKLHSAQHTNLGDSIVAIETELGTNPSDGGGKTFATVKARMTDQESRMGAVPVYAGTTAPASPVNGMVWLDTSPLA